MSPILPAAQRRASLPFTEDASPINRIAAIASAIIAAVASFIMLPFEGALMTTLGIGALFSICACSSNSDSPTRARHVRFVDTSSLNTPHFLTQLGRRFFSRPDPERRFLRPAQRRVLPGSGSVVHESPSRPVLLQRRSLPNHCPGWQPSHVPVGRE